MTLRIDNNLKYHRKISQKFFQKAEQCLACQDLQFMCYCELHFAFQRVFERTLVPFVPIYK